MKISMNSTCRVRLTGVGTRVYERYFERLNLPVEPLENDSVVTELWDLFNIFGESIYQGCEILFERNEIEVLKR